MQLFSKDAFAFREQFQNLKKVQSICLCGLFVAAYVALSFFSIKMTEFLEFRFAFLALAAAALLWVWQQDLRAMSSTFSQLPDRPLFPWLYHQLRDSRFSVRPDSLPGKDYSPARFCSGPGRVYHCLHA